MYKYNVWHCNVFQMATVMHYLDLKLLEIACCKVKIEKVDEVYHSTKIFLFVLLESIHQNLNNY